MADGAPGVDATSERHDDGSSNDGPNQPRRTMMTNGWTRFRARRATGRLRKLGFGEEEVAALTARETVTLGKWLAPARGDLATAALVLIALGVPLVIATYRDSVKAAHPTSDSVPVLSWVARYSAPFYAAMLALIVAIILAVAAQALAERWGNPDRSLGLTCRRLLRAGVQTTHGRPDPSIGATDALGRRRLVIRNGAALRRRAARAGLACEAVSGVLREAEKEHGDPFTHVRALLRDHTRGLSQDTAILHANGAPRFSDRARRGLDSALVIALIGAAASIAAALVGRK